MCMHSSCVQCWCSSDNNKQWRYGINPPGVSSKVRFLVFIGFYLLVGRFRSLVMITFKGSILSLARTLPYVSNNRHIFKPNFPFDNQHRKKNYQQAVSQACGKWIKFKNNKKKIVAILIGVFRIMVWYSQCSEIDLSMSTAYENIWMFNKFDTTKCAATKVWCSIAVKLVSNPFVFP